MFTLLEKLAYLYFDEIDQNGNSVIGKAFHFTCLNSQPVNIPGPLA